MPTMITVVPGELITREAGHMKGHGTHSRSEFSSDDATSSLPTLVASNAGVIERVNKLISVKPLKFRYEGRVGDIVVGRITEVGSKNWKVDIGGIQDARLDLSAVNLPGGVQRMRTYEDQLKMRSFFTEGDLISAEVQSVKGDGSMSLHTRSLKYGKLENGLLIDAPPSLMRRVKQHALGLDCGVDVILGNNGSIWICRGIPEEWMDEVDDTGAQKAETLELRGRRHAQNDTLAEDRLRICRVRNAVALLSGVYAMISPKSIMAVFRRSLDLGLQPKDMVSPESRHQLLGVLTQQQPNSKGKRRRDEDEDEDDLEISDI
mmetsp:Transcript_22176/g.30254  ORF Transcript_22176/g.30254 Transcript_22176/m.30254 type:complete len:319 (-) Transcript_22176:325-1281(-)|eukprot:CAMPEP_0185755522 /NCGR_PEP_ID=MMETSP1174-20130828/14001_1 /TAXON_ID=35687 /ORGANISM="Dictyocha speculum, Strain CCMP1381" /LENGTH=318 /DNA_ID=CAMNT_0028434093 /DNA_START=19 /DNA_END=975 /DNA_ORIENTATION=-